MKVAIIGAGFAGLSAGYNLAKKGVKVEIFEKEDKPGGLAVGFSNKDWKWSLEKHYHHFFYSDWFARKLAEEVGVKVIYKRPKTNVFYDNQIYELDSASSLLKFSKLSFAERIRTGFILFYLKITPFWRNLENISSSKFLKRFMGGDSWKVLWKPLFEKKFDEYKNEIPASWFWARIKKRSAKLGYPVGGFLLFAEKIEEQIIKNSGKFHYKTEVNKVRKEKGKFILEANGKKYRFDKVVVTLPSPFLINITEGLPVDYVQRLKKLKGIGAINMILSLNNKFFEENEYWLSINDLKHPYLALVEHTNFMDSSYYNNENLLYIGNYLKHSHTYFKKDKSELLREFVPHLKKINPKFEKDWVVDYFLFKGYFAQPVITKGYSKILPELKTPLDGLYLANIQQVYPWDRGTNYAIELGEKVANLVVKSE